MREDIGYPYHVCLVKYLGKAIQDTRKKKRMRQSNLADITGASATGLEVTITIKN